MEETQVISVRMPKSLIRDLEKLVENERYWKRNSLICKVLKVLVLCADKQTVYDILRWWQPAGEKYELIFRKVEPKPKE